VLSNGRRGSPPDSIPAGDPWAKRGIMVSAGLKRGLLFASPHRSGQTCRIVFAGFPMHVIVRGIDRAAMFFVSDRQTFLAWLGDVGAAEAVSVHDIVPMTSHDHILLNPGDRVGAARLMKGLGFRYVQYVNRAYGRTAAGAGRTPRSSAWGCRPTFNARRFERWPRHRSRSGTGAGHPIGLQSVPT
jgi:REP element-mobilizing transposase RayT